MKEAPDHVCPRCGGGVPNDYQVGAYPGALSRVDNETEICSSCGVAEAIFQWMMRGNETLPPVNEPVPVIAPQPRLSGD